MAAKNTDWLTEHIKYLSALKSPSDKQKLLLMLFKKIDRTQTEDRTFTALVKSEKALERAKKARAEVTSLLADEKRKAAKAERALRTHKLIELGLLFSYAELDELPREFLAGLLIFGGKMSEDERGKLSQIGAQLLALKEPKKAPMTPPENSTPVPQPAPTQVAVTAETDTFLTIDFLDKDDVKNLGARWSGERRQWYVPAGQDLRPFSKWIKA